MTYIVFAQSDGTAGIASVVAGAQRTPEEIGGQLAHDGTSYTILAAAPDLAGLPMELHDYDAAAPAGVVVNAERLAQHLHGIAAAHRYTLETGGAVVNGAPFATDRESQAKLAAERTRALQGQRIDNARWKGADGQFRSYTNAAMAAAAEAIGQFVADAFEAEADVAAAIDAGTITSPDEIAAAPEWPSPTLAA